VAEHAEELGRKRHGVCEREYLAQLESFRIILRQFLMETLKDWSSISVSTSYRSIKSLDLA